MSAPPGIPKDIGRCIVPILFKPAGASHAEQIASGTLIALKSHVFLLTAGHVVDYLSQGGLFVPGYKTLTALPDTVFTSGSPSRERKEDRIDFAHFYLNPVQTVPLRIKAFQPQQMAGKVLNDAEASGARYVFYGFPASLNSGDPRDDRFTTAAIQGPLLHPREYRKLEIEYSHHLAIHYVQKRLLHQHGPVIETIEPPSPRGLSGGAVLRISTNEQADLVGVIIEYQTRKNLRALIAIRIEFLIASILDAYPWTQKCKPIFKNHEIIMMQAGMSQKK